MSESTSDSHCVASYRVKKLPLLILTVVDDSSSSTSDDSGDEKQTHQHDKDARSANADDTKRSTNGRRRNRTSNGGGDSDGDDHETKRRRRNNGSASEDDETENGATKDAEKHHSKRHKAPKEKMKREPKEKKLAKQRREKNAKKERMSASKSTGDAKAIDRGVEAAVDEEAKQENPVFPFMLRFDHLGYWTTDDEEKHVPSQDHSCSRNSVMLRNTCLPWVLKVALRHQLASSGHFTVRNLDPQNLVPHLVVRSGPNDSASRFDSIRTDAFVVRRRDVSCKSKFLMLELGPRADDLHYTLVYYKTGVPKGLDLMAALETTIRHLTHERIAEYQALPDFGGGARAVAYWSERRSYPNGITPPLDFVLPPKPTFVLPPDIEVLPNGVLRRRVGLSSSSSSSASSSSASPSLTAVPLTPLSNVSMHGSV